MGSLEERYPWVFLVIGVLLVASALLWLLEALSGNKNAYVSALFIVLNLAGFFFCLSVWQKHRHKHEGGSNSSQLGT